MPHEFKKPIKVSAVKDNIIFLRLLLKICMLLCVLH